MILMLIVTTINCYGSTLLRNLVPCIIAVYGQMNLTSNFWKIAIFDDRSLNYEEFFCLQHFNSVCQ